jgi:hypothetical protein
VIGGWLVDYADPTTFFATLSGKNIRRRGTSNYLLRPAALQPRDRADRPLNGEARAEAWPTSTSS